MLIYHDTISKLYTRFSSLFLFFLVAPDLENCFWNNIFIVELLADLFTHNHIHWILNIYIFFCYSSLRSTWRLWLLVFSYSWLAYTLVAYIHTIGTYRIAPPPLSCHPYATFAIHIRTIYGQNYNEFLFEIWISHIKLILLVYDCNRCIWTNIIWFGCAYLYMYVVCYIIDGCSHCDIYIVHYYNNNKFGQIESDLLHRWYSK